MASTSSQPSARSPDDLRLLLAKKRWSVSNLAVRWGMSREAISRIISNRKRPAYWDDAINGLPQLSLLAAKLLTEHRLLMEIKPKRQRTLKEPEVINPWLSVGDLICATEDIGSMASAGDEGLVLAVLKGSAGNLYRIQWPEGTGVFPENEIENLVVETGKTSFVDTSKEYPV